MLICFSLAVLFGLTWGLGYGVLLTQGDAYLACSIIFCLSTTTQVRTARDKQMVSLIKQLVSLALRQENNSNGNSNSLMSFRV